MIFDCFHYTKTVIAILQMNNAFSVGFENSSFEFEQKKIKNNQN